MRITDNEVGWRYHYVAKTLATVVDYRLTQRSLAEVVSRHVYTTVTTNWLQRHWAGLSSFTRETYPDLDLWVLRPIWQTSWMVGATTNTGWPRLEQHERYRQVASRIKADLRVGNLRDLASLDPEMASYLSRYEAFLADAERIEREYRDLLASLHALPEASASMLASL